MEPKRNRTRHLGSGDESGVSFTHRQLVKAGATAQLHVWEGMVHGFFNTDLDSPETLEAWGVTVDFFHRYLGR